MFEDELPKPAKLDLEKMSVDELEARIETLKAQIADDCDTARAILARLPAPDANESAALPRRQARS